MSEDRDPIEQLDEMAALPPDDPRRVAFERTPRGRAMLAAYLGFLSPGQLPAEAGRAEARDRLQALLAHELGLEAPPAASAATPSRDTSPRPRARSAWRRAFGRPALAFAALLIVAGALWLVLDRARPRTESMRGHRVDGTGRANAEIVPNPPRVIGGGAVELTWSAVTDADRYEVTLLGGDLADLGVLPAVATPRLVIAPGALPAGLHSGERVLWQVTARHGSATLAESAPAPIQLP